MNALGSVVRLDHLRRGDQGGAGAGGSICALYDRAGWSAGATAAIYAACSGSAPI